MSDATLSQNPHTRGIARFVSGLQHEAVPAEVLTRLKLCMLDSIGCAIYGADPDATGG